VSTYRKFTASEAAIYMPEQSAAATAAGRNILGVIMQYGTYSYAGACASSVRAFGVEATLWEEEGEDGDGDTRWLVVKEAE
jgi:hypothetical protein